jgi:hypothetical protein
VALVVPMLNLIDQTNRHRVGGRRSHSVYSGLRWLMTGVPLASGYADGMFADEPSGPITTPTMARIVEFHEAAHAVGWRRPRDRLRRHQSREEGVTTRSVQNCTLSREELERTSRSGRNGGVGFASVQT